MQRKLKVFGFDVWNAEKGIIFANDREQAIKIFHETYRCKIFPDECDGYISGTAVVWFIGGVPKKPSLFIAE